jgi:general secretion pathway protein D
MMTERQSRGWLTLFQGCGKALVRAKRPAVARKVFIFICAVTVVLSGGCLFAAEQGAASPRGEATGSGVARYRVFSLKHISAEQGKKYLAEAGVGTVSQLPGREVLLVTAQPEELIKASAILELVDAEEPFYIKVIFPASEVTKFPSNEQIAAKVGDISIGTFSNPPSGTAKTKAIIDVHNGSVIAVAPDGQLERIISAIEQLHRSEAQALQGSEPNKSAKMDKASGAETETITESELKRAEEELKRIAASSKPAGQADSSAAGTEDYEPNELFDKLLNSIAKTEEMAVKEQAQQLSQPNAVATVPETNEPSEPSADLKQTEESASQATEEPQEPNLAAVESSETNEAAEKLESEPNLKPVSPVRRSDSEDGKVRSYEPQAIADGNEMLELDLPEKLNIMELLDLMGKYLHLDYLYDEKVLAGKEVSLRFQGPIKVRDLYPLVESVLKFRGFVMTRKGNLVTIVPTEEALNIDPALHPEAGDVRLGDVVITRVFKLKHIDTASAQNLLVGMKLGANISPIPETGTLIVTEYAYRMARVEELLEIVDQPGAPKQFRFRQLKYTMAATLAPKIKALAEQLGNVSVTVAAPSPAQPLARPARGRPAPTPTPSVTVEAKPGVYLEADERTNRILMIGLVEQLIVVDSLIDSLDVEQQDLRTMRLYDIQHVGADEVVKKLGELGIISGGGGRTTTGRISTGARPTAPGAPGAPAAPAPAATAETSPLAEEPQVVVIESTNSLLVNATAEQHVQIATIISYVDSETLQRVIPYEIYALENQNPEDLAEVLQKFIQETIKDKEGKIQQTIKKTEEDIIIVPDKNTFSILVYASKKNQEWIGSLIKQLDKRRPQVLIDVSLVEIAQKNAFEYDLNLIANAKDAVTGNIAIKSDPLPYLTGSKIEGGFDSSKAAKAFQGFFSDDKIQALLTAIDTKHYGRILAKPKILVNDNEEGKINTTETTYVGETTTSYPSQGTTGGVLNPVYTTAYKPYEAKIELVIKPHISEGNLLRLEVTMVREDFKNIVENKPPDYTKSNITTIVTVPDGSTIILGGLTKLNQEKDTSKVPLLGDIPLVGALFRGVNNKTNDTHLYVFVKANILRPSEIAGGPGQLTSISDKNKAAFEDAERSFQTHQDIPGIEPEPIEPLRVLEAE